MTSSKNWEKKLDPFGYRGNENCDSPSLIGTRTNNESYHLHESEGGKQAFLVGDRVMCLQNIYSSPDGSGSKEYVDEDESDFEDNEENMKKKAALLANKSIIFAHGEVGIVRNIFGNMSPPELEVEKLRSDGTPCGKLEHYETKLFKCCYAFTVNKVRDFGICNL